ncbi:hypothetical protein EJ05DRAFT_250483 [Pseudovirgaria hyperparasitica]|uniref:Uncharacterized protein n=1 Tax=Pseudovirgaria hyperparasitica TaxID=470096 RepID=A0A6A6WG53_9PEZI|nr:uncharacterized protein EJ05DRAFT_250483 [Pseudovirgaria hyperparasitica]KAF2761020.1 hypothetical protein EJ05DRAFT_250483 [Pseudovirgaria hyperparasitica]
MHTLSLDSLSPSPPFTFHKRPRRDEMMSSRAPARPLCTTHNATLHPLPTRRRRSLAANIHIFLARPLLLKLAKLLSLWLCNHQLCFPSCHDRPSPVSMSCHSLQSAWLVPPRPLLLCACVCECIMWVCVCAIHHFAVRAAKYPCC